MNDKAIKQPYRFGHLRDELEKREKYWQAQLEGLRATRTHLQKDVKALQAQLAERECKWTKSQIGLGLSWDEYDATHLIISTKYLSEEKLKSLLEELVQYVGLEFVW